MTQPQQWPYTPYPAPVNMYAILSLVFAVAVFPPLGIYFGAKAKRQITQTGERGIELANVGVVIGWIFTVAYGLVLMVWCAAAGSLFMAG